MNITLLNILLITAYCLALIAVLILAFFGIKRVIYEEKLARKWANSVSVFLVTCTIAYLLLPTKSEPISLILSGIGIYLAGIFLVGAICAIVFVELKHLIKK